jgi:RHS repeat-associated protein
VYDNRDRLQTRTDPLQAAESYQYDANGNVIRFTDRKNQATTVTYDGYDRPGTVTYNDNSTTTYTFDDGNRITKEVDSFSGTFNLTWDVLDRVTQEATPNGTVNYTYDNADRRTGMTVVGQPQVTHAYDVADRLTNVTQGSSVVTIGYDAADRRISLTLPNSVTTQYGYDVASELTSLTYKLGGTTLGNVSYGYDNAGNRASVAGTYANVSLPTTLTSASYNPANRLTQWGSTTLAYDANGSMTSDGTNSFTWDVRNRLISMTGATFQYDPFGRRINRSSAKFLYDGANRVQELSGSTVTANLLPGLGVDETFTRTDSAGTRSLLTDALGNTVALTDTSGTVQTQYTYEPFGKTTISGPTNANPFQYTGRESEGNGLYYYRARYYNPTFQRFISEDPLGLGGGDVDLYAYAHNSPTNLVDPSGLADNTSPWRVGWEWLTGTGPRTHNFTDGDPFTELLRKHQHIQDLIGGVCNGTLRPAGDFDYSLAGWQGVPKYGRDYSTVVTGGTTGNLAVTYLGSYQLKYSVTGRALDIQVSNESNLASLGHPPVLGYMDWWQQNLSPLLNNLRPSGFMSPTTQHFDFHENLACGCK